MEIAGEEREEKKKVPPFSSATSRARISDSGSLVD